MLYQVAPLHTTELYGAKLKTRTVNTVLETLELIFRA